MHLTLFPYGQSCPSCSDRVASVDFGYRGFSRARDGAAGDLAGEGAHVVEQDIKERDDEESEERGGDESADHGAAHGGVGHADHLGVAQCHGQQATDGGARGHEDGAQALTAGLDEGLRALDAFFAQAVGEIYENDRVVHDDADEDDHADHRHHVHIGFRNVERPIDAKEREGDRDNDGEREDKRLEEHAHEEKDKGDRKHGGEQHRVVGFLEANEAVAFVPAVSARHLEFGHGGVELFVDGVDVAAGGEGHDGEGRLTVLASDLAESFFDFKVSDGFEGDFAAVVGGENHRLEGVDVGVFGVIEFDLDIDAAPVGSVEAADIAFTHGVGDGAGDIAGIDPEFEGAFAIDHDLHLVPATIHGGFDRQYLGDIEETLPGLVGVFHQSERVIAVEGDCDRAGLALATAAAARFAQGDAGGESEILIEMFGYFGAGQAFLTLTGADHDVVPQHLIPLGRFVVFEATREAGVVAAVAGFDGVDIVELALGVEVLLHASDEYGGFGEGIGGGELEVEFDVVVIAAPAAVGGLFYAVDRDGDGREDEQHDEAGFDPMGEHPSN